MKRKRQRKPLGLPAVIARGIDRAERARRAEIIARPMREMLNMLEQGEVYEAEGHAVMHMPAIGDDPAQWCAIAPAIRGWLDCWARVDSNIDQHRLKVIADRLEAGKEITPRLAAAAREEFETAIQRIAELPPGAITRGITTTHIAWEFERLGAAHART